MKKILLSVMTLVLVVGMVGAGAFAYFSDTETSTGNIFTAGTIDLEVDDQNPWARAPFVVTNAKPCEKYWDLIKLHNAGDNEFMVWKHITIVECTGGLNPEPEQVQEALTGVDNNLAAVVDYDLVVDDSIIIPQGTRTLESMNCEWWYLGTLAPSQVMMIAQSYHIMEDADNRYQGDTCTFTVEFYAEQLGGLGPPPPAP